MPAKDLQPDDLLVGHDNKQTAVESVSTTERTTQVYNLRVSEDHTYFVGDENWGFSVWVHNVYKVQKAAGNKWNIIDLDNPGELVRTGLRSKEYAQSLIDSEFVDWSNYSFKHSAPKSVPWKEIVKSTKSGPAKYLQDIDIEILERNVFANGIPTTNGKHWKVFEFANDIGASAGKMVRWVRVEFSGGTIHGHPISYKEYLKLTKVAE